MVYGGRTDFLMSIQAGMASGSTIAVGLRFYTRVFITGVVGMDDWLMLVSLLFSWGVSGPGLASAHYGMGRHMADLVNKADIPKALMWVWVARVSTIVSFSLCKLSIAFLLLRIASIRKVYRHLLYGSMVMNVCVSFVWLFMTIKCVPASANWNGVKPGDKCVPNIVTVNHAYWAGAAHSALDLFYATLPIALVWDLKLSTRVKVGLCALLTMGLFACACSIKKITETARLGAATDITWEFTDLSIWNMVELNVGIMCGSIPCIRPLIHRLYTAGSNIVTTSGGMKTNNRTGYGKMGPEAYRRSGQNASGGGTGVLSTTGINSKHGGGKKDWYGNGTVSRDEEEAYQMQSGLKHTSKSHVSASTKGVNDEDSDGASTENILPTGRKIMQTTEVEVRYADRERTDSVGGTGGGRAVGIPKGGWGSAQ